MILTGSGTEGSEILWILMLFEGGIYSAAGSPITEAIRFMTSSVSSGAA